MGAPINHGARGGQVPQRPVPELARSGESLSRLPCEEDARARARASPP
jgi:hypothetical protein